MDWVTIKNGIHAWYEGATGLSAIWAKQNAPRPAYPYGLIEIINETSYGVDENRMTYNGGAPLVDIDVLTVGNRSITVNFQVLNAPSGADPLPHDETAHHYLGLANTALGQQSSLDELAESGVAYRSRGTISILDKTIEEQWISQASLDVIFGLAENLADDPTTYIAQVEISGDFEDSDIMDFDDETFGG